MQWSEPHQVSFSIHLFSVSFFCCIFVLFCFSKRQGLTVTPAGLELTEIYVSLPLSVGIKGNTTAPGSLVTGEKVTRGVLP